MRWVAICSLSGLANLVIGTGLVLRGRRQARTESPGDVPGDPVQRRRLIKRPAAAAFCAGVACLALAALLMPVAIMDGGVSIASGDFASTNPAAPGYVDGPPTFFVSAPGPFALSDFLLLGAGAEPIFLAGLLRLAEARNRRLEDQIRPLPPEPGSP